MLIEDLLYDRVVNTSDLSYLRIADRWGSNPVSSQAIVSLSKKLNIYWLVVVGSIRTDSEVFQ
jgi:hypothetical protein